MMVMLYTYQNKSLDYLARKFNISYFDAKEIIISSRFGGTCGQSGKMELYDARSYRYLDKIHFGSYAFALLTEKFGQSKLEN